MLNSRFCKHEKHPFHLVDPSPWPISTAFAALQFVLGLVTWFHNFTIIATALVLSGFFTLIAFTSMWFKDVITESAFQGHHTKKVVKGLKLGMILFIVSEVLFFFSFFWGFFHYSLSPSVWVGGVWPPFGIVGLHFYLFPTNNTILLLASGFTLTYTHSCLISNKLKEAIKGSVDTILLACSFTLIQGWEYMTAPFHINDSVYGSIFYMLTGFHGFHVIIGTIFIAISCKRFNSSRITITRQYHFGFVAALWYWHFVDVVWIFVYMFLYIWGSWDSWPVFFSEGGLGGFFRPKPSVGYYIYSIFM